MSPRLLDLFSGAGGAAVGYHRAGFEVVGVDLNPQPRYPFEFHQGDAMSWPLEGFDAIHASPPCQGYSTMSNRFGSKAPRLIAPVRERLIGAGVPYVIENVEGAGSEMRAPMRLTGAMFGSRCYRPRLFELSFFAFGLPVPRRQDDPVAVYGKPDGRRLWTRKDGTELRVADLATGSEAMGIDWMTWDELREAIPPAYTEFVGRQLIEQMV